MPSPPIRVLIVDDEPLVSMLLEDILSDLGCEIVGPAGSVLSGVLLASEAAYDCAVLDFLLGGQVSLPVADAVRANGKPFAFVSGYGAQTLGAPYDEAPTLPKPFRPTDVAWLLQALLPDREVLASA